MPTHAYFSRQLAKSWVPVEWHYTTLLSVAIECISELPDDIDNLINELLLRYPLKPDEPSLNEFLCASERVAKWFKHSTDEPRVIRFNLDSTDPVYPIDSLQPRINSIGELAHWLDITPEQLNWWCNLWRFDAKTPEHLRHYRYQLVDKRDGGTRLIEKPKSTLKRLQRKIKQDILVHTDVHPAAHGFCTGKGCQSHAAMHVGKRYLLKFDIAECFQSIGWMPVKSIFKNLGYPDAVSMHLAALCTHSVRLSGAPLNRFDVAQKERLKQRHLPQGAPTSPALMNTVLYRMDVRFSGLAASLGLDYSRYADDIALSGNKHRDWRFLESVIGGICLEEGLCLNYRKTSIKRAHQKQRVVGIVVNRKINVDRQYFDNLKAILTNCVRYGIDSQNYQHNPQYRAHLWGRVQYVKSLNENRGLKLQKLFFSIR